MRYAIETRGLSKHYGSVKAVEELTLTISEGEIYAFLGLNGAGKTTTIRLLLGLVRPTSGSAMLLGTPIRLGMRQPWASVGYLVETPQAYPELTVYENLEVSRRLHPGTEPEASGNVIERMGLAQCADRRAGTLSLGNAQRLGLAKALLHKPRLLILDEPANGLDPAGIVEIRHLLLTLAREQGVTIFISSHILGEVARVAQRIGIIHGGRLLQELSIGELGHNRRKRLLIQTRNNEAARSLLAEARYDATTRSDGMIEVTGHDAVQCPDAIATLLVAAAMPPTHLVVEDEGLEEYFLRLIGPNGVSGTNHYEASHQHDLGRNT
jgi:ABC-2 type transport system ATP-binding protein